MIFKIVFSVLLVHTTYSAVIERIDEKEFKVIWNIPTHMCHKRNVTFDDLARKFGIVQNTNEQFHGDKMVIMYDPGNFPAILIDSTTGEPFLRNGGLPQEGNLTDHLVHFEEHINNDIPNYYFNGVAVIDFESWRPVFRQNFGSLIPYKTLSYDLEREKHPTWTNAQIQEEAKRRFEIAGRLFVEYTIILARTMRPFAQWGYYAYPYCYNMNNVSNHDCPPEVIIENDRAMWIFAESDTLHPSIYLPKVRLNETERMILIEGRVKESLRINAILGGTKQILPYFWYNYSDTYEFLSKEDARNAFIILKSFGLDGVILWGSSKDVNTKEKCENLYNYINKVLGPIITST